MKPKAIRAKWLKPTKPAVPVRQSKLPKLRRKFDHVRHANMLAEREDIIADLRDACIGELHAAKLTDRQVHERHGPTPQTIKKWRAKETRLPQLATARMLLRAVGKDLAIVDYTP